MSYGWLKKVGYSAETEAMIFAMQDGVIHMSGYRTRIMGERRSDKCIHTCKSRETISHILSSCERYKFLLYKDRIVLQVARAVSQTLGIWEKLAPKEKQKQSIKP